MAYNGWRNRATWNVALWVRNDEGLYHLARECANYETLRQRLRELGITETGDGVAYNDSGLDVGRLDEMVAEL